MHHLLILTLVNSVSVFLSLNVPGKPLSVALVFAAGSYLLFIFREKLYFLGPRVEPRLARMVVVAYAYALASGYIIVWGVVKVVSRLFPSCQPSC